MGTRVERGSSTRVDLGARALAAAGCVLPLCGAVLPVMAFGGNFAGEGGFRTLYALALLPALAALHLLVTLRGRVRWAVLALAAAAAWGLHAWTVVESSGPIMWDGFDEQGRMIGGAEYAHPSWGMVPVVIGCLLLVAGAVVGLARPAVAADPPSSVAPVGARVAGLLGALLAVPASLLPLSTGGHLGPETLLAQWGGLVPPLALALLGSVVLAVLPRHRSGLVVACLLAAGLLVVVLAGVADDWLTRHQVAYPPTPAGGTLAAAISASCLVGAAAWAAGWPARSSTDLRRDAAPPRS